MFIKSAISTLLAACLLVCLTSYSVVAQDSTQTEKPKEVVAKVEVKTQYLTEDSLLFKYQAYNKLDTTLNGLHRTRATQHMNTNYLGTGNVNAPAVSLVYNPFVNVGFKHGINVFDVYRQTNQSVRYFQTQTPYTQFKYVQGDGTLQYFDAYHNQSLNDQLSFGVAYHSRRSEGFYLNESNRSTSIALNSRYKSFSNKYQLLINGIWNTFKLTENGGLDNLDLFEIYSQTQRVTTAQFLENKNAQLFWRDASLNIRQMYYLGKSREVELPDSQFATQIDPRFYATHKFSYSRLRQNFASDSSNYFPSVPHDYTTLFSTWIFTEIENEFALGWFLNKEVQEAKDEEVLYGGIKIQNVRSSQWDIASLTENETKNIKSINSGNNAILFVNLSKKLSSYTYFKGSLQYVAVGSQFSDYLLKGTIRQKLLKGVMLQPFISAQARSPFYSERYPIASLSLPYEQNLRKMFSNELGASLAYKANNKLTLSAIRSDRYIFFNEDLQPVQIEGGFTYAKAQLQKSLVVGKFTFQNNLIFQTTTSGLVQVPNWYAQLHYYYETDIFKGAGQIRLGGELFFISASKLNAYMPGLMQFYVQDEISSDAYTWFDVYISARVKRWNGMLKFEHASQGLMGQDYQLLPNYALYPRSLRMGVAWRFYD